MSRGSPKEVLTLYLVYVLVVLGSWVVNFVKLTDCDFESDYKCEVIHGLGVAPVVSLVTVWFDTDEDK